MVAEAQNKLGSGAVNFAQPAQPPQDQGHMRAENAAVDMGFIHHHISQAAQKARPGLMIGQDAEVQHIRVGKEDPGVLFDLRPLSSAGVSPSKVAQSSALSNVRAELIAQIAQLVLGQGFGGEKIKSAAAFFQQAGPPGRECCSRGSCRWRWR